MINHRSCQHISVRRKILNLNHRIEFSFNANAWIISSWDTIKHSSQNMSRPPTSQGKFSHRCSHGCYWISALGSLDLLSSRLQIGLLGNISWTIFRTGKVCLSLVAYIWWASVPSSPARCAAIWSPFLMQIVWLFLPILFDGKWIWFACDPEAMGKSC